MIVGITGGSGCGKTTALRAFENLGGFVLDCDRIYHSLLKTDKAMLGQIEARFPGTVENGTLDRKKLGQIVFSDKNALLELNSITHKAVKKAVQEAIQEQTCHVAIDAIGLFEGGLAELCHTTVAVTAPEEDRIARLMTRDSISREAVLLRLHAQRPQEEFVRLCSHHLHNDTTQQDFYTKCLAFFSGLGIIDSK